MEDKDEDEEEYDETGALILVCSDCGQRFTEGGDGEASDEGDYCPDCADKRYNENEDNG